MNSNERDIVAKRSYQTIILGRAVPPVVPIAYYYLSLWSMVHGHHSYSPMLYDVYGIEIWREEIANRNGLLDLAGRKFK